MIRRRQNNLTNIKINALKKVITSVQSSIYKLVSDFVKIMKELSTMAVLQTQMLKKQHTDNKQLKNEINNLESRIKKLEKIR